MNLTGQPTTTELRSRSSAAGVCAGSRTGALVRLAGLAAFVVCCGTAFAQDGPVVARAASVSGRVMLAAATGIPAFALTRGYVLNPGDQVDTRGGGRLTIDLSDGSLIMVQPETVLVIKDYRQAASLRELFQITLGQVRVKINHFAGKPNPYRMNSPTASIAVRGTEFVITVDAEGITEVDVYEGLVEVSALTGPEQRVLIEAGRAVLVRPGQMFRLEPARSSGSYMGDQAAKQPDSRAQGGNRAQTPAPAVAPAGAAKPGVSGEKTANNANAKSGSAAAVAAGATAGAVNPPYSALSSAGTPVSTTSPVAATPVAAASTAAVPRVPATASSPVVQQRSRDDYSPRAAAGTYERYIAGLSEIGQSPFLLRFNAFPEAHLDSLENPAFAGQFRSGEARLFLLPTFSGLGSFTENTSVFGSRGTTPVTYSIAPQLSIFSPVNDKGLVLGGSFTGSRSSDGSTSSTDTGTSGRLPTAVSASTDAANSSQYFSGALVAAQRFGKSSMGLELEALKGSGSLSQTNAITLADDSGTVPEVLKSSTEIRQTRMTVGLQQDLGRGHSLGAFYRYGWISATDANDSHTLGTLALALESTRTAGHSIEFGLRVRGPLTAKRLFYGFDASWLGLSLREGLVRSDSLESQHRDRASRFSAGVGMGFLLRPHTVLSVDFAGGTSRARVVRTETAGGGLLQTGYGDNRFLSAHVAVQTDVWRRLFASASLLALSQDRQRGFSLFADSRGRVSPVYSSFLPVTSPLGASRYSDYGVGWRFSQNLFAQYVFSTDYGVNASSHTVMFRYTFRFRREK